MTHRIVFLALSLCLFAGTTANAQDGNVVDVNGVKYRETTLKQQRQVIELKEQTRTYKQTRFKPEVQKVTQTVMVPVTDYVWQAVPVSSWNPFGETKYEWRQVPITHYQPQVQESQVTVMKPEYVDVQVVEQVPVARLVDVDVKTRVAVNGTTPGMSTAPLAVLRDPNAAAGSTASLSPSGNSSTAGTPWSNGGVSLGDSVRNPSDSTAARSAWTKR